MNDKNAAWGRKIRSAQTLARRTAVAERRLKGEHNQSAIARDLGVSQGTISKDFVWLDEQYRQIAAEDIAAAKGRLILAHEAILNRWLPAALLEGAPMTREGNNAAKVALKTLQQMARIYGLEDPKSADGAQDIVGLFRRIAQGVIDAREPKDVTPREIEPG